MACLKSNNVTLTCKSGEVKQTGLFIHIPSRILLVCALKWTTQNANIAIVMQQSLQLCDSNGNNNNYYFTVCPRLNFNTEKALSNTFAFFLCYPGCICNLKTHLNRCHKEPSCRGVSVSLAAFELLFYGSLILHTHYCISSLIGLFNLHFTCSSSTIMVGQWHHHHL